MLNQLEHHLTTENSFVRIIPLSDFHVGSAQFNRVKFQGFIDYIHDTPDTYTMILGDTIENALRGSVGDGVYAQIAHPEKQMDMVEEMMLPLADKKKIICWTDSNHSFRTIKECGISPEKMVAKALGVPYIAWGGLLKIYANEHPYLFHLTHGAGGGSTIGGVMNKLMKQASRVQADIYLRGHHHIKVIYEDMIEVWGEMRKRGYGVTGSFLNYKGSYAEMAEYNIPVQGCIKIKLYTDEWDFRLSL